MLQFPSACLAGGALPQTPRRGLQRSPDHRITAARKNVAGAWPQRQHSYWVIGGKIWKRLKTPGLIHRSLNNQKYTVQAQMVTNVSNMCSTNKVKYLHRIVFRQMCCFALTPRINESTCSLALQPPIMSSTLKRNDSNWGRTSIDHQDLGLYSLHGLYSARV